MTVHFACCLGHPLLVILEHYTPQHPKKAVSFDFLLLLCFEDVILDYFMYAIITADTVLLAYATRFVSITETPAKCALTTMLLSKSVRSDIAASLPEHDGRMQHLLQLLRD